MVKQQKNSNLRYERKYIIEEQYINFFLNKLYSKKFYIDEIFPKREVHSFYYDTPELIFARENIYGYTSRKKLRFRCYGNLKKITKINLEVKKKDGAVGKKIKIPLVYSHNFFHKKYLYEWFPIEMMPNDLVNFFYELIPIIRV